MQSYKADHPMHRQMHHQDHSMLNESRAYPAVCGYV